MGFTERTSPKYRLPQFQDDDKPTWRGDFNEAMRLIDAELARLEGLLNSLQTQVNNKQDRTSQ